MKKLLVALLALTMLLGSAFVVSAADASPVKDYATANDGDLLYTVNFKGDSAFTPAVIHGTEMDYVVSEDGSSVTIKGNGGADSKANFWGGKITGLDYSASTIYTMTYKVTSKANDTKNNSIGVGGVLTSAIDGGETKWLNNYSNHGVSEANTPRSSISISANKQKGTEGKPSGDYVSWKELAIAKDADGYVDMMIVFDGVNNKMTTYVLGSDNNWIKLEAMTVFPQNGNAICLITYAYYQAVNTTVKDVKYYKGDLINPAGSQPKDTEPQETEPEATEPEATEPEATEPEATNAPTPATDAADTTAEEGGCGSSVAVMGIGLVAAAGVCTAVFSKKKKED
ncbi:MAG: hypothetical protein IJY08_06060 [Clostridia bacterium]|nr:hypothetical protein [Clostridia bacterium]